MGIANILIVEDETAIAEMIQTQLELAGFTARFSANGALAQQMVAKERPDLIIADWMMPMMSGIEFTRRLKRDERTADIPIILLTARSDEDDRVNGLDAGADDYIVKPFSGRELIARIHAILRRTQPGQGSITLTVGLLELNTEQHACSIASETVSLGPLEYRLLDFFMRHPNRVYSRSQLLDRVWGANVYVDERTVDVHIRRLRVAIGYLGHDQMIETVRGAGYRLNPDFNPTSIPQ
ncbi:MAG: phosphate regulon transcriptional regulator PhoB [Bacterioplanes sp.]|nr:phosphate regulon transcriptional regulator PhoB [Bacterioplanes sp.]